MKVCQEKIVQYLTQTEIAIYQVAWKVFIYNCIQYYKNDSSALYVLNTCPVIYQKKSAQIKTAVKSIFYQKLLVEHNY